MKPGAIFLLGAMLAGTPADGWAAAKDAVPAGKKPRAHEPVPGQASDTPKPKSEDAKPADAAAGEKPGAKVDAISSAMEAGYGKLFEGVKRDSQQRVVLRFSGHDFPFDDGKKKSADERIDNPDMEDMFAQVYPLTNPTEKVEKDFDPGRARVEEFFKLLYGATESEVSGNLKTVDFCGTKVRFNAKCGAADALAAVAKDLDALIAKKPEVKIFTKELGGTFQWRVIAGTKRLSNHSFGTAIDLNVKKSAYWRWSKPETLATFSRKDWPTELIEIFEQHGFIWGGKWWHYDTMHFEYRPELIAFAKAAGKGSGPADKASEAPPVPDKPEAPKAPEAGTKPPPKDSDLVVPLKGHGKE